MRWPGISSMENLIRKKPYTEETQAELLRLLSPAYIQGLTLLGGEPFEPENQRVLVKLLRKVRETYPEKDIWCYTGYTYEKDLLSDSVSSTGVKVRTEVTDEMLSYIDCLVDGEFVLEKKDSTLLFRGSSFTSRPGLRRKRGRLCPEAAEGERCRMNPESGGQGERCRAMIRWRDSFAAKALRRTGIIAGWLVYRNRLK